MYWEPKHSKPEPFALMNKQNYSVASSYLFDSLLPFIVVTALSVSLSFFSYSSTMGSLLLSHAHIYIAHAERVLNIWKKISEMNETSEKEKKKKSSTCVILKRARKCDCDGGCVRIMVNVL